MKTTSSNIKTTSNKPNQIKKKNYQAKPKKRNTENQTYQAKPTIANLPNHTYQTKPTAQKQNWQIQNILIYQSQQGSNQSRTSISFPDLDTTRPQCVFFSSSTMETQLGHNLGS